MSAKDKVAANKARAAAKVGTHWSQDLAMAIAYEASFNKRYPKPTLGSILSGESRNYWKLWAFRSTQYLMTYHEALGYQMDYSPGKGRKGMRKFVRTTLILPKEQMTTCGVTNAEGETKWCRFAQGCTDCKPGDQKPYVRAITRQEKALAARIRRRDVKARPSLLERVAASTEAARKAQREADRQGGGLDADGEARNGVIYDL